MAAYHHRHHGAGSTKNGDSVIVIRLGEVDAVYLQDFVPRPKSTLRWPIGIHLGHNYSLRRKKCIVLHPLYVMDDICTIYSRSPHPLPHQRC